MASRPLSVLGAVALSFSSCLWRFCKPTFSRFCRHCLLAWPCIRISAAASPNRYAFSKLIGDQISEPLLKIAMLCRRSRS